MAPGGPVGSVGSGEPDESAQEEGSGRHLAGAAGAAAAAGGAIAGAQGLLGLDVADAATGGDGADGAVDSVVPLGEAPAPADAFDRSGDVDAFLDEDATVALGAPDADPLVDDTAAPVDDPVGAAFAADDPAAGLGSPGDVDHEELDPFHESGPGFDESGPGEDPGDAGDELDVFDG